MTWSRMKGDWLPSFTPPFAAVRCSVWMIRSMSYRKKERASSCGYFARLQPDGGGTPCFHNNMHWMNAQGITIYLQASAQQIYDRLVHEKDKRPLLKNTDAHSLQIFIEDKLAEREPFYRQASYVIPVNELHLESLSALDKQTRNA